MKFNRLLIITACVVLFSCNSSNNKEEEQVVNEEVIDSVPPVEEAGLTVVNRPSLWTVEFENSTNEEKLKKPEGTKIESLSANELISLLNQNFADVQLQLNKISHDTLYANIPESDKLTQQMGSTGAYNYLATVVYNLTELPNVKYIKLDFAEGDHAMPGVYTREDFKTLR